MPAYVGQSFEELRCQDYNQNRRYGSNPGNTFASGAFGGGTNQASGLFGSQAQNSPFGTSNNVNQSPAFGATTGTTQPANIFGNTAANQTGTFGQSSGLFGNNNNLSTSTPSSGLFGSNTSSTFGANPGTPNTGAFGQANSNPFGSQHVQISNSPFGGTTGNTFGQGNTSTTKPFSFGGNQTNNSFGSGTTNSGPSGNSLFAQGPGNATNTSTGSGLFGQSSANTNTNQGLFGQNANTPGTGGGFNFGPATNSTPATTNTGITTGGFNFGSSSNGATASTGQKPFSFGTPASGTSGTFGASQNNAPKAFSFGPTTTGGTANSSSLFNQAGATSGATTNNLLFGNSPQGTNLFGNGSGSQVSNSSNVFGKPATGNLFGNSQGSSTASNLFGASQQQNTASGFNVGSVAPTGNQAATSIFGQVQGSSIPQSQPAIEHNPYGTNPLFSSVSSQSGGRSSFGPIATLLVNNNQPKKAATLPQFKLASQSPASNRIYGIRPSTQNNLSPVGQPRKSQFSLFDENLLLQPNAFSPRSNLKRLVIDRKVVDRELLAGGSELQPDNSRPPKTSDAGKLQVEIRRASPPGISTDAKDNEKSSVGGQRSAPAESNTPEGKPDSTALRSTSKSPGTETYWTSPSMTQLLEYSKAQLSKVKDFKVGRRGYGQISFSGFVDLSTLETLEDVTGQIVVFEPKMCTVYPQESIKPEIGRGLNVPATITLEQCFPLSKDTRQPIRDTAHPRFQQHVDRLKRMTGTEFVDYLADTGTWVFRVNHF